MQTSFSSRKYQLVFHTHKVNYFFLITLEKIVVIVIEVLSKNIGHYYENQVDFKHDS